MGWTSSFTSETSVERIYSQIYLKRAHSFVSLDLKICVTWPLTYLPSLVEKTPSANDLKNILESSGVGYDAERADTVVSKLAGKTVAELIEEGSKKMASMPAGGAAPAAGGAGAAAGGDAPEAEKKEEKKEESEESDDDMGFGLFD